MIFATEFNNFECLLIQKKLLIFCLFSLLISLKFKDSYGKYYNFSIYHSNVSCFFQKNKTEFYNKKQYFIL